MSYTDNDIKFSSNDIRFAWKTGYTAAVIECQLIIADEIIKVSRYRNANAKASCQNLKNIKDAIEKILENLTMFNDDSKN